MATIHDFKDAIKSANNPEDREIFRTWYKQYLKSGSDRQSKKMSEDELNAALNRECDEVEELMPENGIESLREGKDCKLCADDGDVRRAEYYATTDLGHERDTACSHDHFGTKHGYALPVHISCCKRCRRNYFLITYMPTIVGIVITLAVFLALSSRAVREPLMAVLTVLPLLIFLLTVGLSMLACALVRRFLLDKLGQNTKFNIFEIDKLRYMKVGGWINLYDHGNYSKLMFSKKLPWYVPESEQTDIEQTIADIDE